MVTHGASGIALDLCGRRSCGCVHLLCKQGSWHVPFPRVSADKGSRLMRMGTGMPETRYARSGDVAIAYQVLGEGPFDVVVAPPSVSHVELIWEIARVAAFLRGLADHARVLVFDGRGIGMSDPIVGAPTLKERSDDIRRRWKPPGHSAQRSPASWKAFR